MLQSMKWPKEREPKRRAGLARLAFRSLSMPVNTRWSYILILPYALPLPSLSLSMTYFFSLVSSV